MPEIIGGHDQKYLEARRKIMEPCLEMMVGHSQKLW